MRRLSAILLFGIAAGFAVCSAALAADPPQKPAAYVDPPTVRSLSFSADGAHLCVGLSGNRRGMVLIWTVADRKLRGRFDTDSESTWAAFSADGKSIAVTCGKKSLVILDPKTGAKTGELGPLAADALKVLPAAPGQWVVLDKDNAFHLWHENQNKSVHDFAGMKDIWSWTVSPRGTWLFASRNSETHIWNLKTGAEAKEVVKTQQGMVFVADFMSEDRILLSANWGPHRVIGIPSGNELLRFKNEGGPGAVAYSPAAGLMACRYYTDTSVALTPLTLRPPTDAERSRTAELLKSCDSDDYATREKAAAALLELGPAIEPLLKAAMTEAASAEVRMRARVARETILNKPKFNLDGHLDAIRAMTFAPDGKLFATGGTDGLVILWNTITGKEVARQNAPSD